MKKTIFTILFLIFCSDVYGAELLVKAKSHWLDSLTLSEVNAMSEKNKLNYYARSQIGDIICVRPDGWSWGKEECLPNFIVIKIPSLSLSIATKYEESLWDNTIPDNPKMVRHRKYAIPKTTINNYKFLNQSSVTITSSVSTYLDKITIKTGAPNEAKLPSNNTFYAFYRRYLEKSLNVANPFWIKNAYAATQLLKTVKPSGGDYTALETCMNANEQNLVTADKYFDVEIDGTWSSADTTAITIHNYTTDATRYINIYTTSAARHRGVWSTSKYILQGGNWNVPLTTTSMFTMSGVQIKIVGTGDPGYHGTNISAGCIFYSNIVWGAGDSNWAQNIYLVGTGCKVYNNISYDGETGILVDHPYENNYIYNNSVYNCNTIRCG